MPKEAERRDERDGRSGPAGDMSEGLGRYAELGGAGDPGQGDLFVCPKCKAEWRRQFVGEEIPRCPKDDVPYEKR